MAFCSFYKHFVPKGTIPRFRGTMKKQVACKSSLTFRSNLGVQQISANDKTIIELRRLI